MKPNKLYLEQINMFEVVLTDKQKEYFTTLKGKLFDIVTYLPLDYVLEQLQLEKNNCLRYVLIEHNKVDDLWDSVNKICKKEHIHIVFQAKDRKRASSLVYTFNTTEVRRIDTTAQLVGSFEYLTHESKKCINKVKYEKSSLISNDIDFFNQLVADRTNIDNTAYEIIERMIWGIPHREMVIMYGKDYIYHYTQYKTMVDMILLQESNHEGQYPL